ncbi:pantothenate kinase [Weissella oryzae SG25]|uniref:Pantothenate kinase n=1 Tax=Weissella oryzae (strain DSM 25784 / JCM 18191 / LMG 30913 / SG25) TaxID=1329250 RepID=A0A069CTB0_WEIOS|nr:type I pantothenate kinase [Weissella oryzae]GAK30483.1 pantothenate kinase [Weissella oryzae SG25]
MVEMAFNYEVIGRAIWGDLTKKVAHDQLTTINQETLAHIKAFNDQISMDDVMTIYQPLVQYIRLRYQQYERALVERQNFLGEPVLKRPFVIGVAGSVAVGKSTTARLLQLMLQAEFGEKSIALTTTDGFLLPNATLKARHLFERKGFPESYDMEALLTFMTKLKEGAEELRSPRYSHEISDVLPNTYDTFKEPKIFIIEGINTLQATPNAPVYVSDFFDLSIYVDAATKLIEEWYITRFKALLARTAQSGDATNFFWPWTQMPLSQAVEIAHNVWQDINLPNLEQYILPTRERADLVLHKVSGHQIDQVWLRKY